MHRLRLFLVVIALVFTACQSGNEDRDREECARLVDHLVAIQLDDDAPRDSSRAAEREKHRDILGHAIRDRVVADCLKQPAARTACALRASTAAELKECN